MYQKILDVLGKIQFDEAQELRQQLEMAGRLHPHAEPIAQVRLLVLQRAVRNSAAAVEALKQLELTDEAMALHSALTREYMDARKEIEQAQG